ncbi:hypothetical protein ACJJTC_019754 [Scirpophaga incertulas]
MTMVKFWIIFIAFVSFGSAYYNGYDYNPPQTYWQETPSRYHATHHSYEPANHDFDSTDHNFRPAHHDLGQPIIIFDQPITTLEQSYHNIRPYHEHHSPNQPCYYTEWDSKSDLVQWWKEDTPMRWSWNNGGVRPTYPWSLVTTPSPDDVQPDRLDKPQTLNFSPFFNTCVRSCHTTSEYNPVCGTNGVTYTNPSHLKCAIECGANVQLARPYKCSPNFATTPNPTTTTLSAASIRLCMLSCPVTSEYNPVCGTNGLTYPNPSRLECAKGCGLDVQLAYKSRCGVTVGTSTNQPPTLPTTPSSTIPSNDPPSSVTPLVITPSVTPSSTILQTVTTAAPTPPTPTIPPTSPTPPTSTTEKDTITSSTDNGIGFTIPKEILDSIFT